MNYVDLVFHIVTLALMAVMYYKSSNRPEVQAPEEKPVPDPRIDELQVKINEILVLMKAPRGQEPVKAEVTGIWEVQRLHGDHWEHEGWVRRDTPAWKKAWNDPKKLLRQGKCIERGVC